MYHTNKLFNYVIIRFLGLLVPWIPSRIHNIWRTEGPAGTIGSQSPFFALGTFQFIKSLHLRVYFLPARFHPVYGVNFLRSARDNDGKARNVSIGAAKCRLPGYRRKSEGKEEIRCTWMAYCCYCYHDSTATGIRLESRVSRSPFHRPLMYLMLDERFNYRISDHLRNAKVGE